MGPIASQHLIESVNWWREDLMSDTSPFTWWWGSEAEERAAWHELKIRLIRQGWSIEMPEGLGPDR